MVSDFGQCCLADVGEFGMMSTLQNPSSPTGAVGSVRWMVPELFEYTMNAALSTSTDMYALGCTILEIITGAAPFFETKSNVAVSLRPTKGFSDRLWTAMDKCWAQSPDDRLTIQALMDDLKTFRMQDVTDERTNDHIKLITRDIQNLRESKSKRFASFYYVFFPLKQLHYSLFALSASAFPEYRSLAGLSAAEVRAVARTFTSTPGAQPPPPAINDTSSKLVFDDAHPWEPLRPGDIRGPCPGLNTLASHGYLNRSGIATPGEIITAVQEGFNMGLDVATFVTYAAFVVDGNHLTNLMSIGAKDSRNWSRCARTRYYWRLERSRRIRGSLKRRSILGRNGTLDITSAAVHRHNRILDSMARNPNFTFVTPRYLTAYAETTFLLHSLLATRHSNSSMTLNLDDARSFFQTHKYPDNFFRRNGSYGFTELGELVTEVFDFFPDIFLATMRAQELCPGPK
ncbi:hypothetical protein BT96DRAFT_976037 [Gymnopus androsaceus JB14]|uniref:Cloroperoxidase n=1 Tax=Gymnopus androsaceus JB14 TaxID=1447944 RepID=A0A6A4HP07_9AGAR|nr:hypothetical protein BT96DRAFT_976037 [Gymnopus androsaceus JB14]